MYKKKLINKTVLNLNILDNDLGRLRLIFSEKQEKGIRKSYKKMLQQRHND